MKKILELAGVVVILAIAYIGFALFFFDPFQMRVYESKSPKGYGDAVLVDSFSIKDFSTTFYVRDPSGNSKLLTVGDFESDEYPLQEIVWSGDGSVVAARGMIAPSGRSYGTFFTCAYDFKKHSIVERSDSSSSVRPFSQKIRHLIEYEGDNVLVKDPNRELSVAGNGTGASINNKRQNKALHPTAYSSIRCVRSSLRSFRFRRRVSLVVLSLRAA